MPELNCTKCGEVKPDTEFHREARNTLRNMKRTQCKACDADRVRKYISDPVNKKKRNSTRVKRRRETDLNYPRELFDARFEEQGNVCAICKSPDAGGRGAFHADHDHELMEPRGILCHNCNVGIGNLKDNVEILEAAIEYLRKWNDALRR